MSLESQILQQLTAIRSLLAGTISVRGGTGGGISGDASQALQTTGNTSLASIDGKLPALSGGRVPVVLPAGGGGLTDAELRATAVPMSLAALPAIAQLPAALTAGGNLKVSLQEDNGTVISVDDAGGSLTVDGVFWQATQPVSGTFWQATQPVSGAFFQATQPISAAALPLPAGASTEATLALIKAKTDNLDVLLSSRTKPGDTQPISAAALPLPAGAATQVTLAAILAAWGVQLPAALTAGGNLKVSLQEDAGNVISVDDAGGSITVDGTITGVGAAATDAPVSGNPVLVAGRASNAAATAMSADGDAVPSWMTRRGATVEHNVRDLVRVWRSINFSSAAAPVADTLCSCIENRDGTNQVAASSYGVITAGNRFRVTNIIATCRTTTAVAPFATVTLRTNPGGAAGIGSVILMQFSLGGNAAVIGNVAFCTIPFTEGLEVSGLQQIATSFANNVATNVTNITLYGYEYTP